MSLLEMNEVCYRYQKTKELALENINLAVEPGEFISIIGANGSGKSTLGKLFNGLLTPTEGEVFISGLNTRVDDNIQQIRQKVGIVFQNPDNQLVATIVEDDVAFGLENLGIPSQEIRNKVDQALEMVGMEGYQSHAPHQLSGGQKQRVAIAGIIAMEPSCIVLDEPTAMLDPRGRKEVMKIVNYLNHEKDITVVYITHFMREACQADKIFVMSGGKIVRRGNSGKVFSDINFLKNVGLSVPPVTELAAELKNRGISLPEVMTVEELVNSLC
ncbi:MAG: energy-coupling factor transporter ATPase [Bacillota bacterium]